MINNYCARLNKILNFHVCSQIFHIFVAENIPSINYALIGEMDPLAWFLFLLTKKKPPPPKREGRTEKKNEQKKTDFFKFFVYLLIDDKIISIDNLSYTILWPRYHIITLIINTWTDTDIKLVKVGLSNKVWFYSGLKWMQLHKKRFKTQHSCLVSKAVPKLL